MATEIHHAISSARRWGGKPEDYLPIHEWFDHSKDSYCNFRHRALFHHAEGIALCEQIFGPYITNSAGKIVPVRWIGEQHVTEDHGRIPTAAEWLRQIQAEPWMSREARRLDRELEDQDAASTIPPSSSAIGPDSGLVRATDAPTTGA